MKNLILLSILVFVTFPSLARFDIQTPRGEKNFSFKTPNQKVELCTIVKKWKTDGFSKSDLKDEATLCSFDFYGLTEQTQRVGLCAKQNSTSPGVLLNILKPNLSAEDFESKYCKGKNEFQSVKAKFKQTISCSHTSSQLIYYHFSRLLGDVLRVPVAVIRTMDIKRHKRITDIANDYFQNSNGLIAQNWRAYAKYHASPLSYPQVFDNSGQFVYGSLIENPKNEFSYTEVSGRGNYETRYERFQMQTPFLWVASGKSIQEITQNQGFSVLAPTLRQMKDVSDMILIDTLLNQQDRIGNIHFKYAWYKLTPESGKIDKIKDEPESSQANQYVRVKEMLLKDNDCGVSKTNEMRSHSILEKVRHLSFITYKNFHDLFNYFKSSEGKNYFMTEFLLNEKEYQSILANFNRAKAILSTNCNNGSLKLDLDFSQYFYATTTEKLIPSCLN